MTSMMQLLRELYPLELAPVSRGTDHSVELLCRELPFEVHEFASGIEHNGWIVPMNWEVERAEIRRRGQTLYDGARHVLGVWGYSQSFSGTVERDELRRHLTYSTEWPEELIYHCFLYTNPARPDWGFSVPKKLFDALEPGPYEVDLETSHTPGTMKVCDYLLPGDHSDTVILNAHNCHRGQANDDVAGIVVGVEVMRRLAMRKRRRLSYRLIVAPEHLGTVFYLANTPEEVVQTFRLAMFLEGLGNENRLVLQHSFYGDSVMDQAVRKRLADHHPGWEERPFRKAVGNDETVWDSAGYDIPTVSLSRFPYPEYHTSLDTEAIISEDRLEESVQAVVGALDILETNSVMDRKFRGLVALSNPRYDLYIRPTVSALRDPSIHGPIDETVGDWNFLMDSIPRYFDGRMTVLDIAERHDLPYEEVLAYVRRFEDKNLIRMRPAPPGASPTSSGTTSMAARNTPQPP